MGLALCSVGAAAVSAIYMVYGAYRDHEQARHRREGVLRERVAFLLWNVANRLGKDSGELALPLANLPGGYLGDRRLMLL
jgi:hypothetical protein